jgi:hypothetical protein
MVTTRKREPRKRQPRKRQQGSALLIVFLFAAILAISLYIEMPSVAFEAKRAKEQLLIDRGDEYAHAVKLYYRKFRAYPPSIAALETTNQIRFLRHKFKDPMTGDDTWRLLHAGAGGQLTDSKVNPIGLTANGQASGSGANNGFAGNNTTASNTAGSAAFGSTANSPVVPATADNNGTGIGVAGIPQRPPEMPIGGGAAPNPVNNADPTQSLLPLTPAQAQASQAGTIAPSGPATFHMGLPANSAQPSVAPSAVAVNGSSNSNPMQGVQGLFANPNPPPGTGNPAITAPLASAPMGVTTTAQSGMGVMQTGGIAGVASLAKGSTIKTVNDQTDYSLWEFYYDPTKDTSMVGQSGINPMNGATQPNASATNASTSSATSPSTTVPMTPGTSVAAPIPFTAPPPVPIKPPQ